VSYIPVCISSLDFSSVMRLTSAETLKIEFIDYIAIFDIATAI